MGIETVAEIIGMVDVVAADIREVLLLEDFYPGCRHVRQRDIFGHHFSQGSGHPHEAICAAVLNGIREVNVNSMTFVPGFQV